MDFGLPHALGLGSALFLALTNALVKREGDVLIARARMSLCAALIVAPALPFFTPMNWAGWRWLAIAMIAHWGYQFFLVRAFRAGDLSLVYPLMRGASPLFAALAAFALMGEQLSGRAILGLSIACVAGAAMSWPARGLAAPTRAIHAALATAAFIALYTVLDALGARAAHDAFAYVAWMFLIDPIGVFAALAARRGFASWRAPLSGLGPGILSGGFAVGAYGAAIYAMTRAPVAEIAALRETSVVFAALLGVIWLREPLGKRRIIAAAAMAAGLMLMRL